MKTHPGTGHPFKIALAGIALIVCIALVYVPAGCKQNGTTESEQEEEEDEPDDNGSDTPPETEETEPEPDEPETAMEYAQQQIPSLAGYFSGFDGLDELTRAYIDEAKSLLTNYPDILPILEMKAGNDTNDNEISSEEIIAVQDLTPLVKDFSQQNYSSAVRHLESTPYVLDNTEVFEAFNRKIIREDFIWYDTLGQSSSDNEIWTNPEWGRIANWNFHWSVAPQNSGEPERVTLMPWYDSEKMKEWFPDDEDRERRLDEMWIPRSFLHLDWTNGGDSPGPTLEFLKSNMSVSNLEDWYNKIITAYNNPDSYEHEKSRFMLDANIGDRGVHGWYNTSEQYRKVLERFQEDEALDLLTFGYGYMLYLKSFLGPPEIDEIWDSEVYSIYGTCLAAKVWGTSVDFLRSIPYDDAPVTDPAYPVPKYLRDEFESNTEIYGNLHFGIGSSVGIYSPVEGKIKDDVKSLTQRIDGKLIPIWSAE